jgi:hypothetical protein
MTITMKVCARAIGLLALVLSPRVALATDQQHFPRGLYVYSNLCIGAGGNILGHRVTFEHQDDGNQVTLEYYGSTDLEMAPGLPVKFDPVSGKLEFRYFVIDDDNYFRGEVTRDFMAGAFSDTSGFELLPRVTRGAVPQVCENQPAR